MNTSQILAKLPDLHILVVGDLMLDHYIWGDVQRISPEAPVPVVHTLRESHTAGGAANVALNLASLGAKVSAIGSLGDDAAATSLLALLQRAGIHTPLCQTEPTRATIVKTRVVARTQQLCRIDYEDHHSRYQLDQHDAIADELAKADAVIISDYAKGAISQELLDALVKRSISAGTILSFDPKPSRKLVFRGVSLLTPNRHEALQLAGFPEPPPGEPYPLEAVCARIHELHAPELLVITLGADGMALCADGEVQELFPTVAREVYDVSGAGDTVIATLTAALAAGASAPEAARLANRAAGVVVSRIGTATVTPDDLLRQQD